MGELKDHQQQETGGKWQFHSCLRLMEPDGDGMHIL